MGQKHHAEILKKTDLLEPKLQADFGKKNGDFSEEILKKFEKMEGIVQ